MGHRSEVKGNEVLTESYRTIHGVSSVCSDTIIVATGAIIGKFHDIGVKNQIIFLLMSDFSVNDGRCLGRRHFSVLTSSINSIQTTPPSSQKFLQSKVIKSFRLQAVFLQLQIYFCTFTFYWRKRNKCDIFMLLVFCFVFFFFFLRLVVLWCVLVVLFHVCSSCLFCYYVLCMYSINLWNCSAEL